MTEFEIKVIPHGYSLCLGQLCLEAVGIIRDRGTIRATVAVYDGDTLLSRDNVNLTGEKARGRFCKQLATHLKDIPSDLPKALLALDEAIRQSLPTSGNGHKKYVHDTPADFSEKPLSLVELKAVVNKWLLVKDPNLLEVVLGVVVAHRLGGESPWLLLVAPPSGIKTEILRALWRTSGIYPLSDLTARTFASGLDSGERETSLLARLQDEVLVLKDFTTVLELHREERQAILAQLREIYDGRYDKAWGTGKELHWEGRLGLLAGVTPVIDQHHAVMAILGPRFLQLRLEQPGREEVAMKAMDNAQKEEEMRRELAEAIARFLAGTDLQAPKIGRPVVRWLAKVADVVTKARSSVIRDGYRRELDYAPEPEGPSRLARQLYALTQGVTLVNGGQTPSVHDLMCITRVAKDCIPKVRQLAIQSLLDKPEGVTTTEVAKSAQYSTATVRRALEDLQALGLAWNKKTGEGHADRWGLTPGVQKGFKAVFASEEEFEDTFSEMSEGVSYTERIEEEMVGGVL